MKIFYTDHFVLPLPSDHRFPMEKYSLLRKRVVSAGLAGEHELKVPAPVTDEQLFRAHDRAYVERVKAGSLSRQEIRRIGFPWSPQLVERARRSCGATLAACRAALEEGVAVNLAGGTHHASREGGEGFCVFNDSAVAARAILAEATGNAGAPKAPPVSRVIVLDCDVHQGNGTAAIFAGDPSTYTFSIHGANNFPFRKAASDLDIALADGTGDEAYLEALQEGLERALDECQAQLAIYLAGADPYEGDRLGRLSLSKEGLAQRDRLVHELCGAKGIAVATVMAGGYANELSDIVDIHLRTVEVAAQSAHRWAGISRASKALSAPRG